MNLQSFAFSALRTFSPRINIVGDIFDIFILGHSALMKHYHESLTLHSRTYSSLVHTETCNPNARHGSGDGLLHMFPSLRCWQCVICKLRLSCRESSPVAEGDLLSSRQPSVKYASEDLLFQVRPWCGQVLLAPPPTAVSLVSSPGTKR